MIPTKIFTKEITTTPEPVSIVKIVQPTTAVKTNVDLRLIAIRNIAISPILIVPLSLPVYTENKYYYFTENKYNALTKNKYNAFTRKDDNLLIKYYNNNVVADNSYKVYNDRYSSSTFWYLPEFQFVSPGQAFFNIISQNSYDSSGQNELFGGQVSIDFTEVITAERQKYFDNLNASVPGFTLNKIPLNLSSGNLIISYENKNKTATVGGTLNGSGNITFKLEDHSDLSAVGIAYRNMADPNGTGTEYGQVVLYGKFTAYCKIEGIATEDDNYIVQDIAYTSDPINIAVPCGSQGGILYTKQKDDVVSPIGCLPPWSKEATSGSIFHEIATTNMNVRVFQSYIQPEFFYIIPSQYYIDRDSTQNFRPSVDIIAMLNPDEVPESEKENIIILNFYIKPALTSYDIASLEQKLLDFCPNTTNGKTFPIIRFPNDLDFTLSPCTIFSTDADEGSLYTVTDKGYNLKFVLSNPLDLATAGGLIPATLKSSSGYQRTITFSLENSHADSTVSLSFHNTTGDVLDCSYDNASSNVTITNKSPLTVHVNNLFFYNKDAAGSLDAVLTQPLTLTGMQAATIPTEQIALTDTSVLATFKDLEADYTIEENADDNLTESRICASYLVRDIVVSATFDPAQHNIQKVEVNAQVLVVNISQILFTLIPVNGSFSGNHPQFHITLPLNDDLAKPENQLMDYTIQFYFNDNTVKETESKQINFGSSPLIVISADDIPA